MRGHYVGEQWKMAEGWGKGPAAVAKSMQGAGEKLESGVGVGAAEQGWLKGESAVQRDGRSCPSDATTRSGQTFRVRLHQCPLLFFLGEKGEALFVP